MPTPLIEVIESCEQDIERFRSELQVIITEADEDGVRDDEETAEIESFETTIADLEQYVQEKRTEFENNHAEWDGLSSEVSELLADFQTLTDWGEPDLQVVDQQITQMDEAAGNMFYRDAIDTFQLAQTNIAPLMDEYNAQSAAKLSYEEKLTSAKERIAECRNSDALVTDLEAILDQVETDFASIEAFAAERDFVTALSSLERPLDEISRVETGIADNKRTQEIIEGAFGDLGQKYVEVRDAVSPYEDLLDQVTTDFQTSMEQFNALMESRDFDQAELVLQQAQTSLEIAQQEIPTREAAAQAEQERLAEQEALLAAERDQLAAELSASPPKGVLWKLYEWKDGDSFDKLASDSGVQNAEVLLGFPNNKKAGDHYKSNNELPAGTLVCVIDPTVKIFKMEVEGELYYLTEDVLAMYAAENSRLLSSVKTNLNTLFMNLEKANKTAYDARHMAGWLTRYMTGWDAAEPASEREKARASVRALDGSFGPENADQFGSLVVTAAADCQAYRAALKTWIAEMQGELKASMETLEFYDKVAKTCAVVAIVTVASPASISVGTLYTFGSVGSAAITAGGASAGLSLFTDSIKVVGSAATGQEIPLTGSEMLANAITAGLTTGVSAAAFGGLFKLIGPAIASRIATTSVVETQVVRLLFSPYWYDKMCKLFPSIAALTPNGTATLQKVIATSFVEPFLKLIGRIGWGESVALRGYIADYVVSYIESNPDVLESPSEEAAATTISNEVLDDATINGMFDLIFQENEAEIESIMAEQLQGLDFEALAEEG